MPSANKTTARDTSLTTDLLYALRYYLGGRRAVIAAVVIALALGAYLNWGWLVAVGAAPLLISLLPCAAMCALGLCLHNSGAKRCGGSVDKDTDPGRHRNTSTQESEP